MADTNKSCGRCSHYGCLINQGMWWCNNGHTDNMDAENCEDYDDTFESMSMTTYSYTTDTPTQYESTQTINPMAKHKIVRAKRKRKAQRGIKHGRN